MRAGAHYWCPDTWSVPWPSPPTSEARADIFCSWSLFTGLTSGDCTWSNQEIFWIKIFSEFSDISWCHHQYHHSLSSSVGSLQYSLLSTSHSTVTFYTSQVSDMRYGTFCQRFFILLKIVLGPLWEKVALLHWRVLFVWKVDIWW